MRHNVINPFFSILVMSFSLLAAANPAAAEVVWLNNWTYQAPPVLAPQYSGFPAVDFSSNGDVILGGVDNSGTAFQTTRLSNEGEVRWSANFDFWNAGYYYKPTFMLDDDTGGAFVSLGEGDIPKIARVDAGGNLVWIRDALAKRLYKLPGGRLGATDCSGFTIFDSTDGGVLSRTDLPGNPACPVGDNLLIDETDNLYLIYVVNGILHATRLGADGSMIGDFVAIPTSGQSAYAVGITGTRMYFQIGNELLSYLLSDASLAWTIDVGSGNGTALSADANPEPIVLGGTSIQRLSESSGAIVWSRTFPHVAPRGIEENAILFLDGSSLVKLNAATGATEWTSPLPSVDSSGFTVTWQRFGGLVGNTYMAVGNLSPTFGSVVPKAVLQPVDFSTGMLLAEVSVSPVSHGLIGHGVAVGDQAISAAYSAIPGVREVRVRSVDTATGATQWETTQEIPLGAQGFSTVYTPDIAADANVVAVVSTLSLPAFPDPPFGALQVDLFDRATGDVLWSAPFHENGQGETSTWGPKLDAAGNVYVDIKSSIPCGTNSRCYYHRIYKLSRLDGSIVWSRDDARGNYEILTNDVLMPGSFAGSPDTLRRLSGVDGSEVWTTSELSGMSGGYGLIRLDDQNVNLISLTDNAKIDVTTGNTAWAVANQPYDCTPVCYVNDGLILPNGDLFQVGEGGSLPYLRRVSMDGSGTVEQWHPSGNAPVLRSNLTRIWKAPSGSYFTSLGQTLRSTWVYVGFIARVDPENGTLSDFQARGASPVDAGSSGFYFNMLDAQDDDTLLFSSTRLAPTLPYTSGFGLLDRTVSAHGDLSVSLSVDDASPMIGQSVGFHMTVDYAGDQPLVGARLVSSLPAHGSADPLECAGTGASNCVIDDRFGGINASFDIQPGGSITINGQLHRLEGNETGWFGVGTHGPTSLSEPDTINNFARSKIIQSLFRGDFDN